VGGPVTGTEGAPQQGYGELPRDGFASDGGRDAPRNRKTPATPTPVLESDTCAAPAEITLSAAEAARTPPSLSFDEDDFSASLVQNIDQPQAGTLRGNVAPEQLQSGSGASRATALSMDQSQAAAESRRTGGPGVEESGQSGTTQKKAFAQPPDVETSVLRGQEKVQGTAPTSFVANILGTGAKIVGVSTAMLLFTIVACIVCIIVTPPEHDQTGLRTLAVDASASALAAMAGSKGVERIRTAVCSSNVFTRQEPSPREECKCSQQDISTSDLHVGDSSKRTSGHRPTETGAGHTLGHLQPATGSGYTPGHKHTETAATHAPGHKNTEKPDALRDASGDSSRPTTDDHDDMENILREEDTKTSVELEKAMRGWESCKAEKATLTTQVATALKSLDTCKEDKSTVSAKLSDTSAKLSDTSRRWDSCKDEGVMLRSKLDAAENATKTLEVRGLNT
jgi:hypothetical protein